MLHTWGQNLGHHPHIHCIVPGGGISSDGEQWVQCRTGFFLPVRVLSRLFRRLFLERMEEAHAKGELQFFSDLVGLTDEELFKTYLAPLRKSEWVIYAKRPFAGPAQVLAYLARYTHRVAIANSRLLEVDDNHVSFRWKDYRENGEHKGKVMRLDAGEFMRRFLLHVLPDGFHRIRHYGLFANGHRVDKLVLCRKLLEVPPATTECDGDNHDERGAPDNDQPPCPCCGGRMRVIETFDGPLSPPVSCPEARQLVSSPLSAAHLIICKSCRGAGHGTTRPGHRHKRLDIRTLTKENGCQRLIQAEPDRMFGPDRIAISVARPGFPIAAPTIIAKSP